MLGARVIKLYKSVFYVNLRKQAWAKQLHNVFHKDHRSLTCNEFLTTHASKKVFSVELHVRL